MSRFSALLYDAIMTLLPILALLPLASAGAMDNGQCMGDDTAGRMSYSPFTPYFHWAEFRGNPQHCWIATDCLFESASESRKQQFAATALVMGLIPLTLKDVAWPEQRLVHVTKRLNVFVEVFVLALGLVPTVTEDRTETRRKNGKHNAISRRTYGKGKAFVWLWIAVCSLGVFGSYAAMVINEIYSKRSALGCPFPGTVAAWYVVALIPAAIHSSFAAIRRRRNRIADEQYQKVGGHVELKEANEEAMERRTSIITAVQGADEDWPVQLSWGIYYIAGTLVFTSIMAITVIELVVWVALGISVSASSKLLAFFLCMAFEDTREKH
ncbi:hypothetical protein P154DRAFT_327680 [Amniculicola lignicola CBS 123094]|uniref:Uncharacterized protein n=1 Tax=Amniculicola lignicola CBS 123094 TaxID=1392246 RepID=A0A6A5W511_9PLEO|nr:hypothetical protein P154DRAFT_327680 [Amniculicola lignicola CBS 123094]